MYEQDEDDFEKYNGNIGYQFRMAKDVLKQPRQRGGTNRPHPVTNQIIKTVSDAAVDEGAKQFAGYEDVMVKLLGKV